MGNRGIYRSILKRPFDIIMSAIAILILLPLFLLISMLVLLFLGKPIIFKQRRPGRKEKLFILYKFRSMTNQKDTSGELLPDNIRLKKFGRFLRSSSLDELPELFNILIGNMSFVGPRPLLEQYLPLYNSRQHRRHEVRPGLTGLAQISGRNSIPWEKRFELDVAYVDHITFLNDIKILVLTFKKIILREGIHSNSAATMEPFTGNQVEPEDKILDIKETEINDIEKNEIEIKETEIKVTEIKESEIKESEIDDSEFDEPVKKLPIEEKLETYSVNEKNKKSKKYRIKKNKVIGQKIKDLNVYKQEFYELEIENKKDELIKDKIIKDKEIKVKKVKKVKKVIKIKEKNDQEIEVKTGKDQEIKDQEIKVKKIKFNVIKYNEIKDNEILNDIQIENNNEISANKDQLLIIGAGGHGKVSADIAKRMRCWSKIAFLDDDSTRHFSMNIPVIGNVEDANKYLDQSDIFVAIGNNTIREQILTNLEISGANIPTLVHPSAILGEQVEIGKGSVLMAGVVVNSCSKIGKGCIINTGTTIDHDNEIEDFAHLSPGVHTAGKVKICKGSWLGIGCTVINDVSIRQKCVIAAGAVVIHDICEEGTYIGIPAKLKQERSRVDSHNLRHMCILIVLLELIYRI